MSSGTPASSLEEMARNIPGPAGDTEIGDLPSRLLTALDGIETTAAFASFGKIGFVDPGVYVHDVGPIYLPLEESQARIMIDKAHQAPYGKGSETIIDTSVRNTWELNSEQFELRRPNWNTFLERVIAEVARELGLDSTVHAELYKMLIYEEGAMFKPHTDTEKVPGMVATLVIGLPSAHDGGEVIVKHRGLQKTFKLPDTQCSYATWYSDVVHEVLPVTAGYRWVLTYNLALDASIPRPSRGLQQPDTLRLHKTLKHWLEQDSNHGLQGHFWYRLDHEYTEASISLRALKTRDLACVQTLYEISTMLPVDIFLAVLEKTEHGSCESGDYDNYRRYDRYEDIHTEDFHPLEDVTSTTYEVKSLVDLDGDQALKGRKLDTESILQKDCFEDISPDENYQGYQGNWGPEATHWYRVTAVAVVARRSTASFLMGNLQEKMNSGRNMLYMTEEDNIKSIVKYYAKLVLTPDADPVWAKTLKELVYGMWRRSDGSPNSSYSSDRTSTDEAMVKILKAAFQTQDSAFFEEAGRRHKGKLPIDFFTWAQEQFTSGGSSFAKLQDGLRSAVLAYPDFKQRHTAVARLVPPTQSMSDAVQSWVHSVHDQMLEMMPQQELNQQDGHAVVGMAMMYYDFPYLLTRIALLVKGIDRGPFFSLGFLSQLDQQLQIGTFPKEEGNKLYREVAFGLLSRLDIFVFNVQHERPKQPEAEQPFDAVAYSRQLHDNKPAEAGRNIGPVTHEEMVNFAQALIRHSLDNDLIQAFWQRVVTGAPSISSSTFHYFWLPFLHTFLPFYQQNPAHPSITGFSQTLTAILHAYIKSYVGPRPSSATSDLVRVTVNSCCGDCYEINKFLRDPVSRVWVQPMNKRRRAHIHQKLDQARVDCTHETDHSRWTNPKLVVTKTFAQVRESQLAWQQRKIEASKQIQSFDQVHLAILLPDEYEDIVRMRALDVPSEQPAASRPEYAPALMSQQYQPGSYNFLPPPNIPSLAGMKRTADEADFVDLTWDD